MKKWPHKKGGLSLGGGDSLLEFYNIIISDIWPYRRMASLERDNIVVYYITASEFLPDRRGRL